MALNRVDTCKFGFVQQNLQSRSRSANNFGIAETNNPFSLGEMEFNSLNNLVMLSQVWK